MNAAIQWLLQGDPAIRWQTLRDLAGAPKRTVERERSRVARDGWGARLLAKQDPEGTWAGGRSSDGGLYSPKWTSMTYTMLLLRDLGLAANNPQARKACALLLDLGAPRDPRLSDAIDMVRSRRRKAGRWSLDYSYKGKTYFTLERIGAPSRWNTLRALRVLKWWNGEGP